jgi:phosphoethanolamine N-methyltransferase
MEHALYYTDSLIEKLQLRWGDGCLSPGGAPELARMLSGIDVSECAVLDLGCGVGGYDILLAEEHGAARVLGVDIDGASLEQARRRAARSVVAERLDFQRIEPGPLPFDDARFDVVFSKDTIVDLPDKRTALRELFRVAKPGGRIVLSDWFRADAPMTPEMHDWATEGDETYEMATLAETAALLSEAGFVAVESEDRNAWFRDFARDEHERLQGPLFQEFADRFGKEDARRSVENARIRALLADQGQLRPGHIRATRPHASAPSQ